MRKRPISIVLISLLLGSLGPASALLWMLTGHQQAVHIPLVIYAALGTVVGYGIWRVKLWGYYSFLVYSATLLIYQLYLYVVSPETSLYFSLMVFAVFAGVVGFLIQQHITAPYFNPQLRWWETNPRYLVNLFTDLKIESHNRKDTVLNVSAGGIFLNTDTHLLMGEIIESKIHVHDVTFSAKAQVVWISKDPEDYGMKFVELNKNQKKSLKTIIRYLVHQKMAVTKSPERTE
jgi:hypothetical protein